ncbi:MULTISPECIES: ribosome recycling factor [unclassified Rathayibacter]|uniref:ribosome recycling factor n=1 Tax=unclassified Rathayibacter TaxID=2609250 RepID=UPI000CE81CA9|nr:MULTISPECIES: ribosome recycling factor [unclassified Rathayibacter]PPG50624.1 ribosome recycling factor [Rathayibacter sp. AY2B3]PPH37252.1 ribosome recycling factor [Rathayibacter sp. AY1E3]PPI23586.1 ribosome recycling factor [Rathayibacter sp. AY1B6]PPI28215.1 ribosome recycling factor [Rathayibacter sp. AY1B5]PPI32653.1 ribosome recycling factor [Rathayibacter sp. AY1B1]
MISDVLADAKTKMGKAVEVAKEDFSTVRTGRANPGMFQKVLVSYYGTPTPLSQLASMQNQEARTLVLTPYDKGSLRDIEQAIRDMPNLGANPTNDGTIIRVTLPELTAERRKEFVKIVRTKAEDAKIAVRNIRRKGKDDLDALKGDVGDDELARGEKELEALTKQHVDAIDEALKRKESELLEV